MSPRLTAGNHVCRIRIRLCTRDSRDVFDVRLRRRAVVRNHHREISCLERCLHLMIPFKIAGRSDGISPRLCFRRRFCRPLLRKRTVMIQQNRQHRPCPALHLDIIARIDKSQQKHQDNQQRSYRRQDKLSAELPDHRRLLPSEKMAQDPLLLYFDAVLLHPLPSLPGFLLFRSFPLSVFPMSRLFHSSLSFLSAQISHICLSQGSGLLSAPNIRALSWTGFRYPRQSTAASCAGSRYTPRQYPNPPSRPPRCGP